MGLGYWALYLTVCWGSNCATQEVLQFDHGPMGNPKEQCEVAIRQYTIIPPDGSVDSVEFQCLPLNGSSA